MTRHDRALRRAVLRLNACMRDLPRAERRVLLLRAGVGIGHVRSRREVARMTHMRKSRVVRLERRGLRQLRALGRDGGCAAASTQGPDAATGAMAGTPPASGAAGAAGAATGGPHVLGVRQSGGLHLKSQSTPDAESVLPSIHGPGGSDDGSDNDLRYPLLALTLALFAFALIREIRRSH